jgi:hypothetical protein
MKTKIKKHRHKAGDGIAGITDAKTPLAAIRGFALQCKRALSHDGGQTRDR